MAIQKLKSPFHANHAKHSADFICEIVDEKRLLRKAIKANDKTIEAQAKEIEKYKSLANKNGRAVCEKRNIISQQAKDIADLKYELNQSLGREQEQAKEIAELKYYLKIFINNKNDEDDDLSIKVSKLMGYQSVWHVVNEVQRGGHKK